MPDTRRPTWPDQPACRDYVIRGEDFQIGRVYLTNTPGGARFVWSIYVNDHVPEVAGKMRAKDGPPQPQAS